jgi:hypothetical protein
MAWICQRCDTCHAEMALKCEVCDTLRVTTPTTVKGSTSHAGHSLLTKAFLFCLISLAGFFTFNFVKESAQACPADALYVVKAINLNLRSSPGVKLDNVLAVMPMNTYVCRLPDTSRYTEKNGRVAFWGRVRFNSLVGWVNLCELRPTSEAVIDQRYACVR